MVKTKSSAAKGNPLFSGDLLPGALSAELIGTFILTVAVLVTGGSPLVVAITVMALVLVFNKVSGAHVNPVVTVALLATKQLPLLKAFGYIVAQILGAMLALIVVTQFMAASASSPEAVAPVFKVDPLNGTWVPVLAELLGGAVFGLAIAAAILGKKEGFDKAFAIGGGLLVAVLIASLGSAGVMNPAVALGVSAYTPTGEVDAARQWWAIGTYALAPVVGGVIGAWLYKIMQWDVDNAKKK